MLNADTPIIYVQREWTAWRTAEVSLADLADVHWRQPAGAPHRLAHAYVSCVRLAGANIDHICSDETHPHRVLVCILKRRVTPSAYAEIARRADEHEARVPCAGGILLSRTGAGQAVAS